MAEHHREKEYMKMMLTDFKMDTLWIAGITKENIIVMNGLDSLLLALDSIQSSDKKQLAKIYSLFYTYGYTENTVPFSQRTISQLRSSGGMRLIRNQKVSDSINFYYAGVDICKEQATILSSDINNLIQLSFKFIDKLYALKGHTDLKLAEKMISAAPMQVREFINRVSDLKDTIGNYNELINEMRTYAIKLAKLIGNEYRMNQT